MKFYSQCYILHVALVHISFIIIHSKVNVILFYMGRPERVKQFYVVIFKFCQGGSYRTLAG